MPGIESFGPSGDFDFDLLGRELEAELTEEDKAKLNAAVEQHKAGNREFAKVLGDYYVAVREAGVDVETARALTVQMSGMMLASAQNLSLLKLVGGLASGEDNGND